MTVVDSLRREQFGPGRHAKVTPEAIGSQPMGKSHANTGKHVAGPRNAQGTFMGGTKKGEGKPLGSYRAKHGGDEKVVTSMNSHAGSYDKKKDVQAVRAEGAGKGYKAAHALPEQGTGSHAKGNRIKTTMQPNEAYDEAHRVKDVLDNTDSKGKRTKPKTAKAAKPVTAKPAKQDYTHGTNGFVSQHNGANARLLSTMTGL